MGYSGFESLLQYLSWIFCLAAAARLVQLRLVASHPFFFAFVCIPIIPQTACLAYGPASHEFFWVWAFVEPLRDLNYILVVWELFSTIFRNYPGLRTLSRWVMGMAAVVAPLGFVLTFVQQRSHVARGLVMAVVRLERGVAFGLLIFILTLLYFLSKYPIRLPRNDIVLCFLCCSWFFGDAAILMSVSFVSKGYMGLTNDALAALEIASYVGCFLLLRTKGGDHETRVRHGIADQQERELLDELKQLNSITLRAGGLFGNSPA